jgi:uncharacterized protein
MPLHKTPGVYREDISLASVTPPPTGVPAFLGLTARRPDATGDPGALAIRRWPEFENKFGGPPIREFGDPPAEVYLAQSVRGFYDNGGGLCYVQPIDDLTEEALTRGLAAIASLDVDLVCAPDIMAASVDNPVALQGAVLDHCKTAGDRMAILDSLKEAGLSIVKNDQHKTLLKLGSSIVNGALYYPWIQAYEGRLVPPCGHVAGVYARSDRKFGVHKAPANEVLQGVSDLVPNVTDADQDELNPIGVNCLRAFPGRGIRVWGARTLGGEANGEWKYISVRRLFLTVGRWIERNLTDVAFEPNDALLWSRIERELTIYFSDLLRQGALKGTTATEAFYVKCNAETNPQEGREAGKVVTEIGLAPSVPAEFIVVRIITGTSGITIAGPMRLE